MKKIFLKIKAFFVKVGKAIGNFFKDDEVKPATAAPAPEQKTPEGGGDVKTD
jgi:hypothetical protein